MYLSAASARRRAGDTIASGSLGTRVGEAISSSELFDLSKDLGEKNNLAAKMPEKVKDLDALLVKRLKASGARLPRRNPEFVKK